MTPWMGRDGGGELGLGRDDGRQHASSTLPAPARRLSARPECAYSHPRRLASPVDAAPPAVEPPRALQDADNRSSVSIEAPFSIGRLTVANPDAHADSASEGTPRKLAPAELPAEHPPARKQHTAPAAIETPAAHAAAAARVSPPPVDTGRPMSGNSASASQRPSSSVPPQPTPVKESKSPFTSTHRNSESSARPSRASYESQRTSPPVHLPRASSSSPDKRHAVSRSQDLDTSKSSRRLSRQLSKLTM